MGLGSERACSFHLMAPQMLSALVPFDIENETRVVRSSLSATIAAFLDKPAFSFFPLPPPEVTIRTAYCVSREMTRFYD
jgi:hypothetical protein